MSPSAYYISGLTMTFRDWKKLTFYYFADAYINFNSLVTDLFKVYKTRIWMSAINPASFASPTLGLQAPSGIGPGAVGITRAQPERRPQTQDVAAYNMPTGRGFTFGDSFGDRQAALANAAYQQQQPAAYGYGYSPFGAPRNVPITPTSYGGMDAFGNFPAAAATHQSTPGRFPSPHGSNPIQENDFNRNSNPMSVQNDAWIAGFQSLSMNTR